MMQAQKKIEEDFLDEGYDDDLEITPALEKYLLDLKEGREEWIGPFETTDAMWESIFGENWREVVKRC